MFTVRLWDTGSTDYGTSFFHRTHGTGECKFDSSKVLYQYLLQIMGDKTIERIEVIGPDGILSWERFEPTPPEFIGQDTDFDNY